MPKFFINHPIFAWVVSILISLAGVIAILGPGEFFGEGCLAGQPLYLSTASTMTAAAPAARPSQISSSGSRRVRHV